MKIRITLLFLFLASFIYAQRTTVYVPVDNNLLTWGDLNYQNNFEGLGLLMNDLQRLDVDLYQKLKPNYDLLQKKKKDGQIILGVGAVVGSLMLAFGIKELLSDTGNIGSPGSPGSLGSPDDGKGIGLVIASIAVYGVAGAIYHKKSINSRDILSFTNRFNEYSEGNKIKISLSPNLQLGKTSFAGLALNIRF